MGDHYDRILDDAARRIETSERDLDTYVRSHHFQLGRPCEITVDPTGLRAVYLRTSGMFDDAMSLWTLDIDSGTETLLLRCDEGARAPVSDAERSLRERRRDRGVGISALTTNVEVSKGAYLRDGYVHIYDFVDRSEVKLLDTAEAADPRLSPNGLHVTFLRADGIWVADLTTGRVAPIVSPEGSGLSYGVTDHVSAEEIERFRGHWWSPTCDAIAATSVDTSKVQVWYLGDSQDPTVKPREVRYPAAGQPNAEVSMSIYSLDGAPQVDVVWDRVKWEYLTAVAWVRAGLFIVLQSRNQEDLAMFEVNTEDGSCSALAAWHDDKWTQVIRGLPALTANAEPIWVKTVDDTLALIVGGRPITPAGLNVREVCGSSDKGIWFTASRDPTETHVWHCSPGGRITQITHEPGVWSGSLKGDSLVLEGRTWASPDVRTLLQRGHRPLFTVPSAGGGPERHPRVKLYVLTKRKLRISLVLPSTMKSSDGPLPVILDPYGGTYMQRVTKNLASYALQQWFADQGYAVVTIDGRGTPGRSPSWSRAVSGNTTTPVVQDQVDGLVALNKELSCLDMSRVAIRGFSFGGYLAVSAVIHRPDVFHAAVAGAPVTDQRLYDSHGSEGIFGDPLENAADYAACSPVLSAALLRRPLMLIHGMDDDNVFSAHTFRMSAALFAAEVPHTVVPLPTGHVGRSQSVEKTSLRMQESFIRSALRDREF